MQTSLAIKYAKYLITLILIISPIIIAYKVITTTFEEEPEVKLDSVHIIETSYSKLHCASELLLNASFSIMLALLWNSKDAIKIGIV